MCVSRLHRVVTPEENGFVTVVDLDGDEHVVSLLAYEGPPPRVGEWIVAHSGFALEGVDPAHAESVAEEISRARPPREGSK